MSQLPEYSKVQPNSLDLEASILSAMLIDRDAVGKVVDDLKPEMFYKTANQEVYAAIVGLYNGCDDIDLLTVMERMQKRGTLEKSGGPAYISEISSKSTTSANIEYHARIVAEKYLQRQVINIAYNAYQKAYRSDIDVLDFIDDLNQKIINLTSNIGGVTTHAGEVASTLVDKIKLSKETGEMPGVVYTGLDELDKVLGGMQPGDFGIIAARPGMGKTTFARQVARKIAIQQRKAVSLQTLEMPKEQIVGGMICSEAGVPSDRIRNFSLFTEDEFEKFEKVASSFNEYPIYVNDTPAQNIYQIRASAKSAKLQAQKEGKEIGAIIIDYLQLMAGTNERSGYGNREQEVSTISKGLKSLAKELGVPVVALSQLSRAVETRGGDKRPQLSDLRESGSLEQDADWVLFLYRPEYYKILEDEKGNSLKGVTEIIVGKNRHGEAKDVRCRLHHSTGVFESLDLDFDLDKEIEPNDAPYTGTIKPETVKTNDDEDIPF